MRERGRPAEVKVHAAGQGEKSSGWNSFDSTGRLPVASEPQLDLETAQQRRDYAHFIAQTKEDDLNARFRHRLEG